MYVTLYNIWVATHNSFDHHILYPPPDPLSVVAFHLKVFPESFQSPLVAVELVGIFVILKVIIVLIDTENIQHIYVLNSTKAVFGSIIHIAPQNISTVQLQLLAR